MPAAKTQLEDWVTKLALQYDVDTRGLGGEYSILNAREAGPQHLALANVIRQLRGKMNDDFLGMAGQPVPYGSADVVIRSAQVARTLDEFLLALIPASELIYCATDIHGNLRNEHGLCQLSINDSGPAQMQPIFPIYGLMAMHRGLCWLTDSHIRLRKVQLRGTQESLARDAVTVFNCNVELGADSNSLVFAEQYLRAEIPRTPTDINAYLQRRPLDILYIPGEERSILAAVESTMRQHLESHRQLPSTEAVANLLKMPESRLLKELALEGAGWQALKNHVRQERAEYLLTHTRHALEEIAEELGFAEVNSFYRAFRRWTGKSPRQFRESSYRNGLRS